jgi:hypothetical protein
MAFAHRRPTAYPNYVRIGASSCLVLLIAGCIGITLAAKPKVSLRHDNDYAGPFNPVLQLPAVQDSVLSKLQMSC